MNESKENSSNIVYMIEALAYNSNNFIIRMYSIYLEIRRFLRGLIGLQEIVEGRNEIQVSSKLFFIKKNYKFFMRILSCIN